MDTLNSNLSSDKTFNRKNFLLAATGVTAYLGMTGRAKASGTQAYLDSAETFTADHTFGGNAFFKSGSPWVDVKAYGALGNGTNDDTSSINTAIAAAITSTAGTNAKGNAMVYFPPGDYKITSSILPPNSASNYILMGAGPWSSRFIWGGSLNVSMLKLVNARGVTIRGLGFMGFQSIAPSYGIEINRGAGIVGTANPTEIVVENVYLGNIGGPCMTYAIGYTADSGYDTIPSGFGTFRDVEMANVGTAYKFGTAMAYGNNIIGGVIAGGFSGTPGVPYSTGIDNTPGPNSSHGGSYSIFGTSTGGNKLLFNVGQTAGYSINAIGLEGESDYQFINTPAALGAQTMQFLGGFAGASPSSSSPAILFNSAGGQLEFHGFELGGGYYTFPGSAAVACYGGGMSTIQWEFNGPLQLHGMFEQNVDFGSAFTNLGSGTLQEYGHDGHLVGAAARMPPAVSINPDMSGSVTAAAGTGATAIVVGTDMAGLITLTTGASGLSTGQLIQVNFAIPFRAVPYTVLMPAESNSAAAIGSVYSQYAGLSAFRIFVSAALAPSTTYQWSYLVMG